MRSLAALVLLTVAAGAFAQSDDAALKLADQPGATLEQASDWKAFVEGAIRSSTRRGTGAEQPIARFSLDVHLDRVLAPGWRLVASDRADLSWQNGPSNDGGVNALKEAYVSWQPAPERIADFGRINPRQGVAIGYNPTDYFRAGALRSVVSIDPASLRENRLGSFMLRGQALWDAGSLSALFSPRLAEQPSSAPLSLDLGATNSRNRWLLSLSHTISDQLRPQWLLQGGANQSPQLGLNLTSLLGEAAVGYFEWSGGRARSLLSQALAGPQDSAFRSRLATGATYTTAFKLSLTAEYQYNGGALDAAGWDALRRGPPLAYARYRAFSANLQDPATRHNVFLYASWQDAFVNRLDVSGMLRRDAVDRSRLAWVEARYRWPTMEAALQWQRSNGIPGSNFGALPERSGLQALLRYFL